MRLYDPALVALLAAVAAVAVAVTAFLATALARRSRRAQEERDWQEHVRRSLERGGAGSVSGVERVADVSGVTVLRRDDEILAGPALRMGRGGPDEDDSDDFDEDDA